MPKMKPLTAGRVARRLLAFYNNDPKKWTKGWFAFDKKKVARHGHEPEAVCFCAVGALERIIPDSGNKNYRRFLEAWSVLSDEISPGLSQFNDSCKDFQDFKTKLHEIARMP